MTSESKSESTKVPGPAPSAKPEGAEPHATLENSERASSDLVEERLAELAAGWFEATPGAGERAWPPPQGEWTLEDWRRLTGGCWRYEVIDGVLYMSPPPELRHQMVLTALAARMWLHARQHQLGQVLLSPCVVLLPTQPVPVQPDLFFVRSERVEMITETQVEGAPDLIVEILSSSDAFYSRREKFALYQEAGVAEYWIVDPDLGTVQVFVLGDEGYSSLGWWGVGEAAQSQVLTGLVLPLTDLFA